MIVITTMPFKHVIVAEAPGIGAVEAETIGIVEAVTIGAVDAAVIGIVEAPAIGSVEAADIGSVEASAAGSVGADEAVTTVVIQAGPGEAPACAAVLQTVAVNCPDPGHPVSNKGPIKIARIRLLFGNRINPPRITLLEGQYAGSRSLACNKLPQIVKFKEISS